jgi:hypothetical protein
MKRITWFFMRVIMFGMIIISEHACYKEDLDRCPRTMRVYFTFLRSAVFEEEALEQTIRKIDLYVFDKDNRLAGHWTDDRVVMGEEYCIEADSLLPGTYSLVAWTNLSRYYTVDAPVNSRGESDSMWRTSIVLPEDRKLRDVTLPHLYFGERRDVTIRRASKSRQEILLEDNLYKFNFTVVGISTENNHDYAFTVKDNNGTYTFENVLEEMPPFEYIASARFDEVGHLKASMTVLRMEEGRKASLSFHDETTGKRFFFSDDLVKLILLANQQGAALDFRLTHEFDIVLDLSVETDVTLIINGWEIRPDDTQLS